MRKRRKSLLRDRDGILANRHRQQAKGTIPIGIGSLLQGGRSTLQHDMRARDRAMLRIMHNALDFTEDRGMKTERKEKNEYT